MIKESLMHVAIDSIRNEVHKVVVGQDSMIDGLLIGLMCNGHILLEGVPGLAKTTTIKTVSQTLGLVFKRVQFTPDLLPSDIIGAEIYNPKSNNFSIKKGPVFTNLLLADEINRAPAKVQSALLEVMQERQVTLGDTSFEIDPPFLVMATQNPIEQEGAYSLPEAQLDRFMLKIVAGYNSKEEELEIARRISHITSHTIAQIATRADLEDIRKHVDSIHIDPEVESYMIDLIFATREPEKYGLLELKNHIHFGASPRASIDLFKASRAVSFLRKKEYVSPVDVSLVIKSVLRHRIILTYEAEAEGVSTDSIIQKILDSVPVP
jgi:MoxR-like ATPase